MSSGPGRKSYPQEPAFAQLPDIGLDLVGQSVLDRRIVLSEYRPSGAPPYAS